jgi:26S proteasome regulatory subunit T3
MPDRRQKRLIFSTITGKMNLSEEVDLEDYVARPDKITGADINAICQEVIKLSLLGYNFQLRTVHMVW